uniref:Glyoxalase/fosfomycin resistance/dioxygenase domain-containing protein n=1 Tax=Fibrocapsa japonica TaxID=94617 RepID=A0A7S2UWQ2_9STRA|mmetsp:Transcript_17458/g.25486  ORF Transcript_17458/g.25486 Transcript_17458/m.25486 type:complete len:261 (+) Transcript_17458:60-842(+)
MMNKAAYTILPVIIFFLHFSNAFLIASQKLAHSKHLKQLMTSAEVSSTASQSQKANEDASAGQQSGLKLHHCSVATGNIQNSLKFYSLLGFRDVNRFYTIKDGLPTKACWMELNGGGAFVELVEEATDPLADIEGYEDESPKRQKALNLVSDEHMMVLGLNHLAIDVTKSWKAIAEESKKEEGDNQAEEVREERMKTFLSALNEKSEKQFQKSVRLVIPPAQQMIGSQVFETAFIADPDGTLIELLLHMKTLPQELEPDW